jgi:ribosomal protein S18 acetylase RimI-like enzyme
VCGVELRAVRAGGPAYLGLVTELLQRQRVADATAGLWEAADLQWWYTRDPHPSEEHAVFWVDSGGAPVVAAVFTQWSPTRYGCDVLGLPGHGPTWAFVRERCGELGPASVEMEIASGDEVTAREAERAGFTEVGKSYEADWLAAADRAGLRELPDGYTLLARPEQTGPHPMIKRNGAEVESRLRQCSLYDPELDLAVRAPGGQIAAYAMFWADGRTGVGLVEPMRVEDEHAGRGVAAGLLHAGLARLAQKGCARLKVSHDLDNEPARRLYHGAGFRAQMQVSTLVRPAAE